jgi:hypothetical protein
MVNKKLIKKLQKIALSESQLQEFTRLHVPIKTYDELNKNNIGKLLDNPSHALMVLYLQKQNFGHWVLLIDHGDYVEYFDSYGGYPDKPLTWLTEAKNDELGQENPLILQKIAQGLEKKPVYYNPFKLQNDDSNTCGRHALVRYRNKNLDIGQYKQALDKAKKELGLTNYDQLVTWLTRDIRKQK